MGIEIKQPAEGVGGELSHQEDLSLSLILIKSELKNPVLRGG